ncbi:hypothetical protein L1987_08487 [Smallanthus sonchifolius]|uniref:Uncharacterized protein n=1 Tax=Smallanthus sonchifolius TaxID=185202 RepID=A0ACB9JLX2_9ASTR|nr:hypothetical protein L1987_08487 [Smallanthus sonchifolius]
MRTILKRQFELFGHIPSEDLTVQFNIYVKLVRELRSVEVELDNPEDVRSFVTQSRGVALVSPIVECVSVSPQFVPSQVQTLQVVQNVCSRCAHCSCDSQAQGPSKVQS